MVVTLLQELGHGVNFGSQKDRQQVFTHQNQRNGGHPFVGGNGQPDGIAGARHPDNLFGGDVGSDQGRTDRPPRKRLTCEKIIGSVF